MTQLETKLGTPDETVWKHSGLQHHVALEMMALLGKAGVMVETDRS